MNALDPKALAERLRSLNPWKDMDWPEVINEAASALEATKGQAEAITPGAMEAFTALDVADRIIERAFGTEVPNDWNDAYRAVAKARSRKPRRALASPATKEGK